MYNTVTNEWILIADDDNGLNIPRADAPCITDLYSNMNNNNHYIYCVGGIDSAGNMLNTIETFDTYNNVIKSEIGYLPYGVWKHNLIQYKPINSDYNLIFMIGGAYNYEYAYNTIYYDII